MYLQNGDTTQYTNQFPLLTQAQCVPLHAAQVSKSKISMSRIRNCYTGQLSLVRICNKYARNKQDYLNDIKLILRTDTYAHTQTQFMHSRTQTDTHTHTNAGLRNTQAPPNITMCVLESPCTYCTIFAVAN